MAAFARSAVSGLGQLSEHFVGGGDVAVKFFDYGVDCFFVEFIFKCGQEFDQVGGF